MILSIVLVSNNFKGVFITCYKNEITTLTIRNVAPIMTAFILTSKSIGTKTKICDIELILPKNMAWLIRLSKLTTNSIVTT